MKCCKCFSSSLWRSLFCLQAFSYPGGLSLGLHVWVGGSWWERKAFDGQTRRESASLEADFCPVLRFLLRLMGNLVLSFPCFHRPWPLLVRLLWCLVSLLIQCHVKLCVPENLPFLLSPWHASLFSSVTIFLVISMGFKKINVSLITCLKLQISRIYSIQ